MNLTIWVSLKRFFKESSINIAEFLTHPSIKQDILGAEIFYGLPWYKIKDPPHPEYVQDPSSVNFPLYLFPCTILSTLKYSESLIICALMTDSSKYIFQCSSGQWVSLADLLIFYKYNAIAKLLTFPSFFVFFDSTGKLTWNKIFESNAVFFSLDILFICLFVYFLIVLPIIPVSCIQDQF